MGATKWRNRPLEEEIDHIEGMGLRWYHDPKKCTNRDCRKESFCRTHDGVCMACVIRKQKEKKQ